MFDSAGGLAGIAAQPAPGADPGAGLRRLGIPPGFAEVDTATLALAVRRGSATAGELGEALRTSTAEVRASLNALIAEGLVHRTGHAKTTRYHA